MQNGFRQVVTPSQVDGLPSLLSVGELRRVSCQRLSAARTKLPLPWLLVSELRKNPPLLDSAENLWFRLRRAWAHLGPYPPCGSERGRRCRLLVVERSKRICSAWKAHLFVAVLRG